MDNLDLHQVGEMCDIQEQIYFTRDIKAILLKRKQRAVYNNFSKYWHIL